MIDSKSPSPEYLVWVFANTIPFSLVLKACIAASFLLAQRSGSQPTNDLEFSLLGGALDGVSTVVSLERLDGVLRPA